MTGVQTCALPICGPVGQGGRGGHGHNDCLAFEAVLAGVHLVSDCGAYVYTASAVERNRFRSSGYHNTPQVNGQELNRFIRWDYLWTLHDDAVPEVRRWEAGPVRDVFVGAHSGYQRLSSPVVPVRTIVLDHARHSLRIEDVLTGSGEHAVTIPLHLAAGVEARRLSARAVVLTACRRTFLLEWEADAEWSLEIGRGRVSPRYGVAVPTTRLLWRRAGSLSGLTMTLSPIAVAHASATSDDRGVGEPAA